MNDEELTPSSPAPETEPAQAPEAPPVYGFQAPEVPTSQSPEPRPAMRAGSIVAMAAAIAFVIAAVSGLAGGYIGARIANHADAQSAAPARVTVVPPKTAEPVAAAAAAAVPSVVNIDVRGAAGASSRSGLPSAHPGVPSMSNGSGVAYKEAAGGGTFIITNNHVVENAKTLTVRDASGKTVDATLVGRDPETDIAVVYVKATLPTIDLADSSKLFVGQTVVAIGSPFRLEHTVTSGVVSALGRSLPEFNGSTANSYPLIDVIQTDAAINPGNSGGALVDRQGRLIGINTAIYTDTGASGGIGFAIPSDTAVRAAEQLIDNGEVAHPFLGVVGQSVTPDNRTKFKTTLTEGAYVDSVTTGSGAEEAGIRSGDIITRLNDDVIHSFDDLILQVRRRQVGDTVSLTVVRNGEEKVILVTVGRKPVNLGAKGSSKESTSGTKK